MKRTISIIIVLVIIGAIFFTLRSNKRSLDMKQEISERSPEVLPVRVDTVTERNLGITLEFASLLEPEKKLIVISQTQGKVEKVNAELGDYVVNGAEVVKVDDDLLQTNMVVVEANLEKARKDLRRFENMIEKDGVTEDQLEKMRLNLSDAESKYRTLQKRIDQTSIEAPFSGFINQLMTKEGSLLGPGQPVFEIVNMKRFEITVQASEEEVIRLKTGMKATLIPKSIDSIRMTGIIKAIAVSTNFAQQYAVVINTGNPYPDLIKGGMIVNVIIAPEEERTELAVKREHIRELGGETFVYRVIEGTTKKTSIQTGMSNDDYVQVKAGLSKGDIVVATGIDKIADGQSVEILNE